MLALNATAHLINGGKSRTPHGKCLAPAPPRPVPGHNRVRDLAGDVSTAASTDRHARNKRATEDHLGATEWKTRSKCTQRATGQRIRMQTKSPSKTVLACH